VHADSRRARPRAWPGATAEADIGATAKALLTLLGAGHTDKAKEPHGAAVRAGLKALTQDQDAAEALATDTREHALATLALGEQLWMSRNPRWKNPAQRAVLHLVSLQREDGSFGDPVTTTWAGMALASARHGKLGVDAKAVARLLAWVKGRDATAPDGAAIALLLRILLAKENPRGKAFDPLATACLSRPPTAAGASGTYVLFATLGMFQRGGSHWRWWNKALKPWLAATKPDGSVEPGPGETDGRVGATALRAMCAQVY